MGQFWAVLSSVGTQVHRAEPSPATLWLHSSLICFDFQRIWCLCFPAPPSTSLCGPLAVAGCPLQSFHPSSWVEGRAGPSRYRKGPSLLACGSLARWLKILICNSKVPVVTLCLPSGSSAMLLPPHSPFGSCALAQLCMLLF